MSRRFLQKFIALILFLVLCVFLLQVYYSNSRINVTVDVLHSWQQCSNLLQNLEQLKRLKQTGSVDIDSILTNATRLREICIYQLQQNTRRSQPSAAATARQYPAVDKTSLSSIFTTNYTRDKFTIIVPTYKRNYCMYAGLRHYCQMKQVDTIIVLWNNIGEEIPRYLNKVRCKAKLKFIKMKENRMTTRYILRPEIKTEAILALDDDRVVTEESLKLAFKTWKMFPHKIIGFCSRSFSIDPVSGQYQYQPLSRFPYSLILPNAAFIHRHYLHMFTHSYPRDLYQYIDDHINVDDIAMNVMISDYLRSQGQPQCAGLLVSGNMTECRVTGSEYKGLWIRKDHNTVRTEYLRLVNESYGYMPLTQCDIAITNNPIIH